MPAVHGAGERLALFAGGALALALVQLLQARREGGAPANEDHGTRGPHTPHPRTFLEKLLGASDRTSSIEATPTVPREIPPELEEELFSRNRFFFKEGFDAIRGALVIVVGLGGVGSHAAHMLVRSGVKRLRVIDFDQVSLSSLNRHAVATWADVGLPKALVLKDRLHAIIPNAEIDARVGMFRKEDADPLLDISDAGVLPEECFVLDCIDDLATKAELIAQCSKKGLRVLSSMGAGLKSDPTRLHIAKLADCCKDRLAMRLRAQLKKAHSLDPDTVECVYSSEEQVTEMLPLSKEQEKNPGDFGVVDNFRVRVLPVLGTTPAIFGQTMACWVLCEIGRKPFSPLVVCHMSSKLRHKMLQRLRSREKRVHGADWPDIDESVLEYIVNQMWRGRCPVTGRRALGSNILELSRWDRSEDGPGCVPSNLVLLAVDVANKLDEDGAGCVSAAAREKIEATLASQRALDW
ncbi:conserved unknown protein [Ectocarpus siliculosus]|uniref:THIF-type NAD/FAD binding fold domain-containing protein n=1 Tax=Ectocarpus siliculosus TaxID=2880 RepID=D7G225_ECTSI|nr:conserved unknown protein [Ectocarpus siliculosus]|eukprot:CBJ33328.1 conserved unknown protein [Ectocarpus siliculosus]